MKRFLLSVGLIAAMFFNISVYAAHSDLYCTYTPKSDKSSLFFIDVYCEREVCAALFELEFDGKIAEYRSVEAGSSDIEASGNQSGDRVVIACTDNCSNCDKLCTVSFKALRAGDCGFRLHMNQAVDDSLDYINDFSDHSLTVTIGKDDVVEDDPSKSSKSSDKTDNSSKTSNKTVKSGISSVSDDDTDKSTELGGLFNVSGNAPGRYILIGAGSLALVAAIAVVGYLLGKKVLIKKRSDEAPVDAPPEDNDGFEETVDDIDSNNE